MSRRRFLAGAAACAAVLGCGSPGGEGLAAAPIGALTAEGLERLRASAGSPAMLARSRRDGADAGFVVGVRRADRADPALASDRWHLGSITKSMTATLVGAMVDAGQAAWDETVGAVLGAAIPDMHDAYRAVTWRHLLSHRSGLAPNIPMFDFLRFERTNADARAERVQFAGIGLKDAPKGPAGSHFAYSNTGYVVAGAMIEAKLGKPWEAAIQERLFTPLGLASAGFGAPPEILGHSKPLFGARRKPHDPAKSGALTDNPAVLGPAGTVHMNAADLLTYLEAHRTRGPLLKSETWDLLHAPPFGGDYALGWVVRDGGLWHNGSNTLWYAEAAIRPDRVACAMTNDGHLARSEPAISQALASALA